MWTARGCARSAGDKMAKEKPKLRLEDKAEWEPKIKVKKLPNPHHAYKEIQNIMEKVGIHEDDITEEKYHHEKGGGAEVVFTKFRGKKKLDIYSKIEIIAEVLIKMKSVNKKDIDYLGDIEIKLKAKVITEYPQESRLQKSILWNALRGIYEKIIYGGVREEYKKLRDSYLNKINRNIKSYFRLLEKT